MNLPFPIENELQTEVGMTLSTDPAVYEALHVLARNSENCFGKDGGRYGHVGPGIDRADVVHLLLAGNGGKCKLFIQHLII